MEKPDVVVIGAGAAGMVAAIAAAERGVSVVVLEKMERAGKKLRITGKGRCNITNTKPWLEFSTHIHPSSQFFRHTFYHFDNIRTIDYFNQLGVKTVIERGDRVYPVSGVAEEVVDALLRKMEHLCVQVLYNSRALRIECRGGAVTGIVYKTGATEHIVECSAVIMATGGLSYPSTGSNGDGYRMASEVGHTITERFPSLTALMPSNYVKDLEGIHLKNVELSLYAGRDILQREFGELDFTSNGIEGPIGIKISRRAVKSMVSGNRCSVNIDLKPAVTIEQLQSRLAREFSGEDSIRVFLNKIVLTKLVNPFIEMNNLGKKSVGFEKMAYLLKNWKMELSGFTSYERAVITAGGVSLEEIVSKSMKSKIYDNLFFAGEVINIDADSGGYNLQIAFSTGFVAGESAAQMVRK